MIRIKELSQELSSLIGWAPESTSSDLFLADALTKSESGLFFQQAHPLLTLSNIASIAPDFKNNDYPYYNAAETYAKGQVVEYEERLYRAMQSSQGIAPVDSDYWAPTNLFSEWLSAKTQGSIQKAILRFYTEKINNQTYKELCENRVLFDGTGRIVDTVKNRNNLVGFELVPIRAKGVTVKINKIGLQFTKAGDYTLYLFHSSSYRPIKTLTLKKEKDNSLEWFTLPDLFLPYQSATTDAGGSWYLCYCQNALPEGSQAIRKDRDWSKGPCKSCSRTEYISWQAWSKYIEVHPFYINTEHTWPQGEEPHLWDVEPMQYLYTTNYGLNLDLTISCDISDFIIEQRYLFQDVIFKQVAVDMLKEFAYNANVRTNRRSINASRVDILLEVDGDNSSLRQTGLAYQLDKAFQALSISLAGLDRVCMPCKNNGIKYRVV